LAGRKTARRGQGGGRYQERGPLQERRKYLKGKGRPAQERKKRYLGVSTGEKKGIAGGKKSSEKEKFSHGGREARGERGSLKSREEEMLDTLDCRKKESSPREKRKKMGGAVERKGGGGKSLEQLNKDKVVSKRRRWRSLIHFTLLEVPV